jgi:AcrR family transcriptional regulator
MSGTPRTYGGVSGGERQAGRREKLLEAGLELLGRDGWSATTVRAVCAEAGLTERYFYESFANRDELLVAIFDRVAAEAATAVPAAVEAAPQDARAKSRAAGHYDLVARTEQRRIERGEPTPQAATQSA